MKKVKKPKRYANQKIKVLSAAEKAAKKKKRKELAKKITKAREEGRKKKHDYKLECVKLRAQNRKLKKELAEIKADEQLEDVGITPVEGASAVDEATEMAEDLGAPAEEVQATEIPAQVQQPSGEATA